MIFGGSIVNFAMNVRRRNPVAKHRPLADYDMVLMLEPLMLSGTVIGVILNVIFPPWLLVVMLAIVLGVATVRTFRKVMPVQWPPLYRLCARAPAAPDCATCVRAG